MTANRSTEDIQTWIFKVCNTTPKVEELAAFLGWILKLILSCLVCAFFCVWRFYFCADKKDHSVIEAIVFINATSISSTIFRESSLVPINHVDDLCLERWRPSPSSTSNTEPFSDFSFQDLRFHSSI